MAKVLEVNVDDQSTGGVYSLVRNVIMHNTSTIQIDIAAVGKFVNEDHIHELNGYGTKVYYIGYEGNRLKKQLVCYRNLKILLKKNKYCAVHIHSDVANWLLVLGLAAKYGGVEKIIMHSHSSGVDGNHRGIKKILHFCFRWFLKDIGTSYVACSDSAAKWMFPNVPIEKVEIIKNGIDLEKFRYNPKVRERVRSELGIKREILIGHVGRFNYPKNHEYLIDIMKAVKASGADAKLLIIGEGLREIRIRQYVQDNNLEKEVLFYGISNKIYELYQAMDVFVLPSHFEGFPIVAVEAQAAGLPVLFSSAITRQAKLTDQVSFIGITEEDISEWVMQILKFSKLERKDNYHRLCEQGFDICDTVADLIRIYR